MSGIFSSEGINGYALGKRMMDITVSMWVDDFYNSGCGWVGKLVELYSSQEDLEKIWLDSIFRDHVLSKLFFYKNMFPSQLLSIISIIETEISFFNRNRHLLSYFV